MDLENGPAVIVHIDFAKLGANQLLDQRQTESARAVLGALRGKARLEDARQLGLRDARTRVADFEEQLRGIFANVDDHLALLLSVDSIEGVLYEVAEDSAESTCTMRGRQFAVMGHRERNSAL